jgi:nicotinamide riboside kinase
MVAMMGPSWSGKSTLARVRAPRYPATSARRSGRYARAAHRQQAEMQLCRQKVITPESGQDYPVCVASGGDSPVQYRSEDEPEEPEPFD